MSDQTIKMKVRVDASQAQGAIRMTAKELDDLSKRASMAMSKASASTSGFAAVAASTSNVVGGLSTAINRATQVISLFHRAMGIFGAISSIVMGVVALWQAWSRHAEQAAQRTEEANRKLADARKKVEELNQARLDKAQKAMRGFADEVARARDNTNALSDAVADLAAAQADFDTSKIDLAVAHGEMTKEEGDLAKAKIATSAAMDAADANKAQKFENLQAAKTVVANFEHQHPDLVIGADGRVDTIKSDAYKAWDSAKTMSKLHANDPDLAKDKHNEEIARQNWVAFIQTARDYENALAALEVATKEYDAALLQGDAAINKALAAEQHQGEIADKGAAEARERSERERAKAQVDWEVQRGEKSEKAGTLEKQRIDLEAELKAAKEALEARRKADVEAGRDTEADDVLATLANTVTALEYKLAIVNDKALEPDEVKGEKASGSSPTISSDQWARIGAFAGNGAQSETLRLQRGSYDALAAIKIAAERIQGHFLKPATTTL